MLPASYQVPAALVLVFGGTVACFFGYRLFRIVLAIFGFIVGALAASALFGSGDSAPLLFAALVGGLAGAGLFIAAYFVGVAIIGAALGVVIANLVLTALEREPQILVVVLFSIAGAVGAMFLQRYFIITGTAFGGAWTLIVGAMALVGDQAAIAAAASGDIWVLYPLDPAPGQRWVPLAWGGLGLIGMIVQLGWTGEEKGRGRRRR
jgi:hypothetical protein